MTVTRINRAVLISAALTLMTILLTSCGTSTAAQLEQDTASPHAPHGAAPGNVQPASEFSIYDLQSEWRDHQDLTLTLADLAGRTRVIAMVYTSCAHACPRILKDMKRIEGELRAEGIDAGYVLVSIDPVRDTPQRLRDYAIATRLDPSDWILLTGTEDGILELAALLGVRYRRVSETEFEHSNVITLLDASGRILHRQVGLGAEPDAIVAAAARLNGGRLER